MRGKRERGEQMTRKLSSHGKDKVTAGLIFKYLFKTDSYEASLLFLTLAFLSYRK